MTCCTESDNSRQPGMPLPENEPRFVWPLQPLVFIFHHADSSH